MAQKYNFAVVVARTLDCIGAFLLAAYALLIVGPLGVLRGPLVLERALWYLRVLVSTGMMARSVRVAIDWRLGHFDVAISQAEDVIRHIEEHYARCPDSPARKRVLSDLYALLARAYMHAGHIDDAMQVILRAKKSLQVDRLVGLADLDAKTAHLVRAGIAAGRLLEGSGLAALFVKSEAPRPDASLSAPPGQSTPGAAKDAKIIPFPKPSSNIHTS